MSTLANHATRLHLSLALPSTHAKFAIKDSPVTSVFLVVTMLALFVFDLYWQRRKRQ